MPNYVPSDLVKAQVLLNQSLAGADQRERPNVIWDSFMANRGELSNIAVNRTREDRPLTGAFSFNRTSRALGTARTHNHAGDKGDDSEFNLTWLERTDVFDISLKQGDNNVFSREQMLANELMQVFKNFSVGHETIASNFVHNNRSQVSAATAESGFDGITFVNEITEATKGTRAPQITRTAMYENKYNKNATYTVYCDSVSFNKFQRDANQGTGNSQNLSWQFGNFNFVESIEMNALASGLGYTEGYWVVIQDNYKAGVDWIPVQNRQGVVTKENMYSSIINPLDGLTYAVHTYEERADDSARNGYTQDVVTHFQVSLDHALELAPLTVANETVAQAFALI